MEKITYQVSLSNLNEDGSSFTAVWFLMLIYMMERNKVLNEVIPVMLMFKSFYIFEFRVLGVRYNIYIYISVNNSSYLFCDVATRMVVVKFLSLSRRKFIFQKRRFTEASQMLPSVIVLGAQLSLPLSL